MRFKVILFVLVLSLSSLGELAAQGTVNFSNIGVGAGGIDGPGGTIQRGDGFSAQLVLSNGMRIGNPTDFLCCGFFSGGIRIFPGIPPGEEVEVFIVIERNGKTHGRSPNFSITLGGAERPPLPPPILIGLTRFNVFSGPLLVGISKEYYYNPFIGCMEKHSTGDLLTHDEFCEPFEVESPSSLKIDFSLQLDGGLKLTWLAGSELSLVASSSLSGDKPVSVSGVSYSDGYHSVRIEPTAPKMFYWLAGESVADE